MCEMTPIGQIRGAASVISAPSSPNLDGSSPNLTDRRNAHGRLLSGQLSPPNIWVELVNRKPDTLRDQYLSGLVQERKLSLAFPKTPTHERQAYCASSALSQ